MTDRFLTWKRVFGQKRKRKGYVYLENLTDTNLSLTVGREAVAVKPREPFRLVLLRALHSTDIRTLFKARRRGKRYIRFITATEYERLAKRHVKKVAREEAARKREEIEENARRKAAGDVEERFQQDAEAARPFHAEAVRKKLREAVRMHLGSVVGSTLTFMQHGSAVRFADEMERHILAFVRWWLSVKQTDFIIGPPTEARKRLLLGVHKRLDDLQEHVEKELGYVRPPEDLAGRAEQLRAAAKQIRARRKR